MSTVTALARLLALVSPKQAVERMVDAALADPLPVTGWSEEAHFRKWAVECADQDYLRASGDLP